MKKKNRILIAGLMAIAVTGASTFAYFTNSGKISANTGDKNPLELNITNGKVEVTGKIGNGEDGTPNWSYDVARYSTKDYDKLGTPENTVAGITTTDNRATDITNYENKHRSPDIEGLDTTDGKEEVNNLSRWKIGTKVIGEISKARPGDAFVLGKAGETGKEGLVITNSSNLTVKIKLEVNNDVNVVTPDGKVNVIESLQNAGWKLYINNLSVSNAEKTTIDNAIKEALGIRGDNYFSLNRGESKKISIRLEFPLNPGNDKQGTSFQDGTISKFDISKLFTIKATQENNPGWNVDGTN